MHGNREQVDVCGEQGCVALHSPVQWVLVLFCSLLALTSCVTGTKGVCEQKDHAVSNRSFPVCWIMLGKRTFLKQALKQDWLCGLIKFSMQLLLQRRNQRVREVPLLVRHTLWSRVEASTCLAAFPLPTAASPDVWLFPSPVLMGPGLWFRTGATRQTWHWAPCQS